MDQPAMPSPTRKPRLWSERQAWSAAARVMPQRLASSVVGSGVPWWRSRNRHSFSAPWARPPLLRKAGRAGAGAAVAVVVRGAGRAGGLGGGGGLGGAEYGLQLPGDLLQLLCELGEQQVPAGELDLEDVEARDQVERHLAELGGEQAPHQALAFARQRQACHSW